MHRLRELPQSIPAYIEMIKEAIFETGDLRQSIEYDEDMIDAEGFVDEFEQ